jgi:hypothetical protein
VKDRIPNAWRKAAGRLALAATGFWGLLLAAQNGLTARASLFLYYLEASRNADGIVGKITLWERVVYSFILSTS